MRLASTAPPRYRAGVALRLSSLARLVGAAIGALAGIVALQLVRLRRAEFLPGWPGFRVNHLVQPAGGPSADAPITLVVVGDSTTAGVGVDRPQDALPYRIAQRVADDMTRPVRVISYGWAGARTSDMLRQQIDHAAGRTAAPTERGPFLADADLVAVVVGANDATHQTPPRRYRAEVRATLDRIRAEAPRARIALCGIPLFRGALPAFEPLIFIADQYARLLRPIGRDEAARAGVAYADIFTKVPPIVAGRPDILSRDGFHPSAATYDVWASVITDALLGPPRQGAHATEAAGA